MSSHKSKNALAPPCNSSARCPPITFRTILKCRNNSISPSPEPLHSLQKSINTSRISSLNTSMSDLNLPPTQDAKQDHASPSQKLKKQEENSSKWEIKDKSSSKIESRQHIDSKIFQSSSLNESFHQELKQNSVSIEQLRRKIENLLAGKMSRFKHHKKGVGLTNWDYLRKNDSAYSELQEILTKFKSVRETQQQVSELASRVQLVQKMIASEAIESELIKQRYFGFKSQRCNIASYQSKQQLESSALINKKTHLQIQTISSAQISSSIGSFISTNREAYSKPDRQSYVNTRYKHPEYSLKRQLLPRSTYSTQFLQYGPMPTFNCRQINSDSLPPHTSLAVKASAYQLDFKQKYNISKPVDFRQLDCYRDKFKNPNISFMNNCKKEMLDASKSLKKTNKIMLNPKTAGSKLKKLLSQTSLNDFYKSQQKRNYQGHSGVQSQQLEWGRGTPKNHRLDQMKVKLRESYLRG